MVQTFHSGPFAHFADIFCEKWLEIEILALDLPKMQQSINKNVYYLSNIPNHFHIYPE